MLCTNRSGRQVSDGDERARVDSRGATLAYCFTPVWVGGVDRLEGMGERERGGGGNKVGGWVDVTSIGRHKQEGWQGGVGRK